MQPPRLTPNCCQPSLPERGQSSPPHPEKKVASVGERHMSGLHREPCAWQEKAMPIPAPTFHSCCNSHKRLLKPKKNKTVILIKQHSGTLKTRWRLLRPTLKLYSLFQKLRFLCAGWMDAAGLTPGSTVMWYFSRESAAGSPCSTAAIPSPNQRETPPSPGSQGRFLKASQDLCLCLLFQVP